MLARPGEASASIEFDKLVGRKSRKSADRGASGVAAVGKSAALSGQIHRIQLHRIPKRDLSNGG